jgi:hypothetical protein
MNAFRILFEFMAIFEYEKTKVRSHPTIAHSHYRLVAINYIGGNIWGAYDCPTETMSIISSSRTIKIGHKRYRDVNDKGKSYILMQLQLELNFEKRSNQIANNSYEKQRRKISWTCRFKQQKSKFKIGK